MTNEGLSGGPYTPLAVLGEGNVGRSGVLATKGPFGLAVTDNEDAGCHFIAFASTFQLSGVLTVMMGGETERIGCEPGV